MQLTFEPEHETAEDDTESPWDMFARVVRKNSARTFCASDDSECNFPEPTPSGATVVCCVLCEESLAVHYHYYLNYHFNEKAAAHQIA